MSTAPIGPRTLVRNAALAGLVTFALWGSWTHGSVPGQISLDHAVGLAAIVVLGAVQVGQAATVRGLLRQLEELRAPRDNIEGLPIGTIAPAFDLPGIHGRRGSLSALRATGRPIAPLFVHPGCGPCESIVVELGSWRDRLRDTLVLMPIGGGGLDANSAWAREHNIDEMLVRGLFDRPTPIPASD